MRARSLLFASLFAAGCVEAPPPPVVAPVAAAPVVPAPAASAPAGPLRWIEDDVPAASARARAEGKALFVDAWAPWCHSCLSMQHVVLTDPALRPLAARVIFASIDTDRPEGAAFLEKYAVKAWPTFFVIDPASDRVVGYWSGSGSADEMRGLVEEGLRAMDSSAPTDEAGRAFASARAAHAGGDLERAALGYGKAVAAAAPGWPSRSAAILGFIQALHGAEAWDACARVGSAFLSQINGAALPGDASSYVLDCAEKLPAGPARELARAEAVKRLREVYANPVVGSTIDDRADALGTLAEALDATGDHAGATREREVRISLLEGAARVAESPEEAHTYDYLRAVTYVELGRAEEAVTMLEQRERELPTSYEPPARLADVLFKANRPREALAAVDRAIARAYGPRRLRYLKLRADIQDKLGDAAGALASRREEAAGYAALPPGQASPGRLADAKKRLEEAERRAAPVEEKKPDPKGGARDPGSKSKPKGGSGLVDPLQTRR